MERAREISAYWPWLPTFRAVAEVEHLGQAARSLGVSSSAVSRTISLLEEELGVELLEREGRGLRLTEAGRILQAAVRDAMRTVHEASQRFEESALHGQLRISSVSPATEQFLHPALGPLRKEYPGLRLTLTKTPISEVRMALLQGRLDVALLRSEIRAEGVRVKRLATLRPRVYAPSCLRLAQRSRYSFEALSEIPFVAMTDAHGDDPYPISESREVVFRADTFSEALSSAQAVGALVVLPEVVAAPFKENGELRELPTPALRPMHLCLAWRAPLALRTAADRVVDFLLSS